MKAYHYYTPLCQTGHWTLNIKNDHWDLELIQFFVVGQPFSVHLTLYPPSYHNETYCLLMPDLQVDFQPIISIVERLLLWRLKRRTLQLREEWQSPIPHVLLMNSWIFPVALRHSWQLASLVKAIVRINDDLITK